MRFSARILLSFFLFAIVFLLSGTKTLAQTAPASQPEADRPLVETSAAVNPYTEPRTNPGVPKNLHTWTQNVMIETMSALTCQLAGIDPVNPNQKCLGIDRKTGQVGFVENGGGAIGFMGSAITMLYSPPARTGDYFRNLASNFGIVKQANAQSQGTGFQSLTPLLGMWTASRNIVYLLFVVIFVVIGIAIMLRVKIDPRTVMTVQNQIPKIIVGLLLVTFSFAIAGFLIDLMYTSIYLTGNAIVATDKNPTVRNSDLVTSITQSQHPFSAAIKMGTADDTGIGKTVRDKTGIGIAEIAWIPASNVGGYMSKLFDNAPGKFITGLAGYFLARTAARPASDAINSAAPWIGGTIGGVIGLFGGPVGVAGGAAAGLKAGEIIGRALSTSAPVIGIIGGTLFGNEILGFLMSLIAFLVIAIAILWALFRLWFALISAYIFLLLDIVFAPFWIFAGLVPGSPISFGMWLRDMLSNLAAFPAAIVMFLLGRVLMDSFAGTRGFVPPLVGGFANSEAIGALIGLGFILLTPNAVIITKAAFKAPKFDTTPIKQALGAGGAVTSGATRETIGSISEYTRGNVLARGAEKGRAALISRIFGKV